MSVRFRTGGGDGRLPPGFRFRPTDEELLTHYLAPKAADAGFAPAAVREVDLYRAEPWDLLPAGGGGGRLQGRRRRQTENGGATERNRRSIFGCKNMELLQMNFVLLSNTNLRSLANNKI